MLWAPAAVRRGWGGARAGRRPERGVGQPEGGLAAPTAAHCLQTAGSRAEGSNGAVGSKSIRLEPWAAGLLRKALRPRTGRSQVGLFVTAARSRELREDAAQTEGAARRCAPSLSLSLGETNLLSGSQLSNLPIMILA